ncbi:MAG: 50S ribosomal protein L21 [Deltaproteobacteria bacterium]|jgi:large subunit ribosomal protein L21|nr:50S ribosomal protein L21 [Deltaproteobacteria bacterium]
MKDYENVTVKELVDELTSLGVSFNKKSRKAELIELLLAETKGKAAPGEDTAETETKPAEGESTEAKSAAAKKSTKKAKTQKEGSVYPGYAIVRTGGKQYQVSAGSLVRVEKITGNVGDTVELTDVLAVIDGDNARIGQPTVEGAVVSATIVEQDKAKKVLVFKKKRRKGYRVKRGHRQMFTALKIANITV